MRTIRISQAVWEEIAKRGKFGETADDVLRRVFNIPVDKRSKSRQRLASIRMTTRVVDDDYLWVAFESGASKKFPLPPRHDKAAIRRVREEARSFAKRNGATYGQEMAVTKALTSSGYHVTK